MIGLGQLYWDRRDWDKARRVYRSLVLQNLDPACDLDIIGPAGRPVEVEHLVANAFGFGGVNASLVLSAT